MSEDETERFTIRVSGTEFRYAGNIHHQFDETYEIEAEHASPAITKLLQEIEWGILDTRDPFTIEVTPLDWVS